MGSLWLVRPRRSSADLALTRVCLSTLAGRCRVGELEVWGGRKHRNQASGAVHGCRLRGRTRIQHAFNPTYGTYKTALLNE
eukprot:6200038-Pleurochrysis_carterae.AAC.1